MASAEVVSLARRIRAARALSGKDVSELAHRVGISKRTWWRLEAGDREPTALELERIAEATSQPIAFFFGASLDNSEAPNLSPLPAEVKPDEGADA